MILEVVLIFRIYCFIILLMFDDCDHYCAKLGQTCYRIHFYDIKTVARLLKTSRFTREVNLTGNYHEMRITKFDIINSVSHTIQMVETLRRNLVETVPFLRSRSIKNNISEIIIIIIRDHIGF